MNVNEREETMIMYTLSPHFRMNTTTPNAFANAMRNKSDAEQENKSSKKKDRWESKNKPNECTAAQGYGYM
jgi:hypothetical protein